MKQLIQETEYFEGDSFKQFKRRCIVLCDELKRLERDDIVGMMKEYHNIPQHSRKLNIQARRLTVDVDEMEEDEEDEKEIEEKRRELEDVKVQQQKVEGRKRELTVQLLQHTQVYPEIPLLLPSLSMCFDFLCCSLFVSLPSPPLL